MSWLENIANEQSKEWQEVMLAHAYDLEEWGDAREKITQIASKQPKGG